ncbi:MAG: rhomboid family intramembrane serine protease [Flavobacteriales bacterium]|jgi:membrane associated rhomboid family serine protease|nr:rhomboid family intramembrane serine protease [Flavobacteriales bacterium]
MSLTTDIKNQWATGGMTKKLLIVNIGVFLVVWAVELFGWLVGTSGIGALFLNNLMGSNNWAWLAWHPWTPITYMFTHQAPMHLFWNMVMLWFSGQLFESLLGGQRMLGNYLLGGLCGFAFYALGSFMPAHLSLASNGPILGASAAVMGVFIGIAAYRPDMLVNLMLLGAVRLKYIALAVLVLDLIAIRQGGNTGGHLAHLGGALYGFVAARQLAQGKDWSLGFVTWLENLGQKLKPKKKSRMRVEKRPTGNSVPRNDVEYNAAKKQQQERIDAILDKISKSGYGSLSKDERDYLFKAGK